MANPSGKNQIPGGEKELPYGGVKQAQQLTREAPMSGAPTPALNTPRRAQRQAVKGKRGGQAQPKSPTVLQRPKDAFHPTSAPPEEPTAPGLAETWAGISQIPGVSPLARQLALRAASGNV